MQQNFLTTKLPTVASAIPSAKAGAVWHDINNILTDNIDYAWLGYFQVGDFGASITGDDFGFDLPPNAKIDGISLQIVGFNSGCYGAIGIGITGTNTVAIGTLNTTYGGVTDLWGLSEITSADLADLSVTVDTGDVSGGDGLAQIQYMKIIVHWHIDMTTAVADVPTRIAYKVYSSAGNFLGELPNVSSKFAFSQDIGSAGSSITITCAKYINNNIIVEPLLTESDLPITTESDYDILTTSTDLVIATGSSADEAMFKNANRIKVWIYNYWYPNGKLMFSGQINRVSFQYGGESTVQLLVYSDGLDTSNFIARGYPFAYTNDVLQTSQNGYVTSITYPYGAWQRYGQTFMTGASVTNIGAISLMLQGIATVTLNLYDGPNGNLLGSITKDVSNASAAEIRFEFAQLISVIGATEYFFTVSVQSNQSINIYRHSTSSTYANGSMYNSWYGGGSGGGSWGISTGDLYFITKSGVPTTTTTYTSDDPVTEMAHGILLDYNARGGYITERDFASTGLSLTYTFNSATIFDAIKKVIEMSPAGYYSYIDLGTAEIDIQPTSTTADFTIVRGKDINQLTISMSIEQVKNYLLLSGGEVSPGVNLFRDYADSESVGNYGIRLSTKSDNRIILTATADAIGDTFIEENSEETQETSLTVLNTMIDTTLLTPGKTIGFKNFDSFVDNMVLQIARRDFNSDVSTLTLGHLPITMSAEIQRINRGLMLEQTINNPSQPS